jgi:hypothetical protein
MVGKGCFDFMARDAIRGGEVQEEKRYIGIA